MPNGCKAIRIYDGSKEGYWAFLTPEDSNALNQYFNSRKLNGEELTSDSPVFANYNKSIHTRKNNYLSAKSVRSLMYNLIKASGIERRKAGNRFDKAATYGFRKRFNTILKLNNEINSNIAEKLMAHKRGLDGTYLQPTREECFNEFLKAVFELTISEENRSKTKIKKLEQEKSEVEELRSFILEIVESQEKLAQNINDIGNYVTKDVINFQSTIDIKNQPKLRTSSGFPKPTVISEKRLDEILTDFPQIAHTLKSKLNN